MTRTRTLLALAFAASAPALAGSFDLGLYSHASTFALPSPDADEASSIAWNWDTNTLFVLGDEGDGLVEVSRTGAHLGTMSMTGFDDTEGLTYIGGGQFVLTEERLQDVYKMAYTAGGSVTRASLPSASLGATIGNIGLEGVAYDRVSGDYFLVKEKTPQAVYRATVDFTLPNVAPTSLFVPALGVADLSDIAMLSSVSTLVGMPDSDNLLILSQESQKLLEVSRTGVVLSQFDLSGLAADIEGVTITADGVIYLASEAPQVFVLVPGPAGASLALIASLAGALRRRR